MILSKTHRIFLVLVILVGVVNVIVFTLKDDIINEPAEVAQLNNQLVYSISKKDQAAFEEILSCKYKERVDEDVLFKSLVDLEDTDNCYEIDLRSTVDSSAVDDYFEGEPLFYEYYADLKCGNKIYDIKVSISKSNKVISLEIR